MKTILKGVLVLVIVAAVMVVVSPSITKPDPQIEAARREAALRRIEYGVAFRLYLMLLVSAAAPVAIVFGAYDWYWRIQRRRYEFRDGLAPVIPATVKVLGEDGKRRKKAIYVNPNNSAQPALLVDRASGDVQELRSAWSDQLQLTYASRTQRTNDLAAVGFDGRVTAAAARLVAGSYDKAERPVEDEVPELVAVDVSMRDGWRDSRRDAWRIGHNASGGYATVNIRSTPHIGITGASGTGKTSRVAHLMALYAIKSGCRVLVLDGKGMGWEAMGDVVEIHGVDYRSIQEYVSTVRSWYDDRARRIAAAKCRDYEGIGERPIVVIIEEFGAVMDGLRIASPQTHGAVSEDIAYIARLGRVAGIHLVVIDQVSKGWPAPLRATIASITFRTAGGVGAANQAYHAHEFAEGEFEWQGERFMSWRVFDEIGALLARAPRPERKLIESTPLSGDGETERVTKVETRPERLLTGRPTSRADYRLIQEVYAETGGKVNETCRRVWGDKTGTRVAWVREALDSGKRTPENDDPLPF